MIRLVRRTQLMLLVVTAMAVLFIAQGASATSPTSLTIESGTAADTGVDCTTTPGTCTVTSFGAVMYTGNFATDSDGGNLTIEDSDGDAVEITAGADIDLSGSLTIEDPSGITVDGGTITTSGAQTYLGPVTLAGSATLATSNSDITFNSTVDGTYGLTLAPETGTVEFDAAVGGATALSSLAVSGPATLGGEVTTSGPQEYDGAVTLDGPATLATTDSNITFASTVDGGFGLTLDQGTGTATFDGAVGSGTALSSLAVDGAGSAELGAQISTSGDQTYSGPITLSGDTGLSAGGTATVDGIISGGSSLSWSGTGTLVLDGANDYTGGTTLYSGTVEVGDDSAFGTGGVAVSGGTLVASEWVSLGNNIDLDGTTTLSGSNNINLNGIVGGNGSLVWAGTGRLTLSGANTYTGGTTLDGGTVLLANNDALGSGTVTLDDATLTPSLPATVSNAITVDPSGGALDLANDLTLTGTVSGSGTLTATGSDTLTLSGMISGAGGSNGIVVDGADVDLTSTGVDSDPITVDTNSTFSCQGGTINATVTNDGGTLTGGPGAPTGLTATAGADGTGSATVAYTPATINCKPTTYTVNEALGGSASQASTQQPGDDRRADDRYPVRIHRHGDQPAGVGHVGGLEPGHAAGHAGDAACDTTGQQPAGPHADADPHTNSYSDAYSVTDTGPSPGRAVEHIHAPLAELQLQRRGRLAVDASGCRHRQDHRTGARPANRHDASQLRAQGHLHVPDGGGPAAGAAGRCGAPIQREADADDHVHPAGWVGADGQRGRAAVAGRGGLGAAEPHPTPHRSN